MLLFFTFSGVLGLLGSTRLFESRVALNLRLGGVRDVAPAIISHEQTQYNRVCCFQTLDAVFPKDPFLQIIKRPQQLSLCRVAALKSIPIHRYSVVIFTFSGPLGLLDSTRLFENRAALNPGLGGVRDFASAIISH